MNLEDKIKELDDLIASVNGDENAKNPDGTFVCPEGADWGDAGIVVQADGTRHAYRNYALLKEVGTPAGTGVYTIPDASGLARFP